MEQRVFGGLVLSAALVGAMLVPGFLGRRVAGEAFSAPLPAAPTAGSCLTRPPTEDTSNLRGIVTTTDPLHSLFGACAGDIFGEVVSVEPDGKVSPSGSRVTIDPAAAADECQQEVIAKIGLDPSDGSLLLPGQHDVGGFRWRAPIGLRAQLIQPDPISSAAGQKWLACTVFPLARGPYSGSIENAFPDGELPEIFAVCKDDEHPDVDFHPRGCGPPHLIEQLAVGQVIDPLVSKGADLAPACERVAAKMMQHQDPTYDGALTVFTYPAAAEYDTDTAAGLTTAVSCLVKATDDRALAGTVIGLGDRMVPMAG